MAILQIVIVGMQAQFKLLVLGLVAGEGGSKVMYWVFFAALVLNSVLVPCFLASSNTWAQREGVLFLDIASDVFYVLVFASFLLLQQGDVAVAPVGLLSSSSNFFPYLRVYAITMLLQKGLPPKVENAEAGKIFRLSSRGAFVCAATSLILLGVIMCVRVDLYPWNPDDCRPCECSKGGVVERCEVDATQLRLVWRGITGITPGAFSGSPNLVKVEIERNPNWDQLEVGVFDDMSELKHISVSRNNLTTLPAGAFTKLPKLNSLFIGENSMPLVEAGAFAGLMNLENLYLWGNSLTFVEAGTFSNLPSLRQLFLQQSMISSCEAGTLTYLPNLETIDFRGNPMTCGELVKSQLPVPLNGTCMD
jgi:hypothetical protein